MGEARSHSMNVTNAEDKFAAGSTVRASLRGLVLFAHEPDFDAPNRKGSGGILVSDRPTWQRLQAMSMKARGLSQGPDAKRQPKDPGRAVLVIAWGLCR
jgi:hypothetical protein